MSVVRRGVGIRGDENGRVGIYSLLAHEFLATKLSLLAKRAVVDQKVDLRSIFHMLLHAVPEESGSGLCSLTLVFGTIEVRDSYSEE